METEKDLETDKAAATAPKKKNFDMLMIVGLLGGWFLVQAWVLPGLGVST